MGWFTDLSNKTWTIETMYYMFINDEYIIQQILEDYKLENNEKILNQIQCMKLDYFLKHPIHFCRMLNHYCININKFIYIIQNDNIYIKQKDKINDFFQQHLKDDQMNFTYFLAFYVTINPDYTLQDLINLAFSKKVYTRKNLCEIGQYIKDKDKWIDIVYEKLRIKKYNIEQLNKLNKNKLYKIIIKEKPTNEIKLFNALWQNDIFVDFKFNFKRLGVSNDVVTYLYYRMINSKDYDYDCETLDLICTYITNNCDSESFCKQKEIKNLPFSFVHLVLCKYPNEQKMLNKIKNIQMVFILSEKKVFNIYTTIKNTYKKDIYKIDALNAKVVRYFNDDLLYAKYFVVIYPDKSFKEILVTQLREQTPAISIHYNKIQTDGVFPDFYYDAINDDYNEYAEIDRIYSMGTQFGIFGDVIENYINNNDTTYINDSNKIN